VRWSAAWTAAATSCAVSASIAMLGAGNNGARKHVRPFSLLNIARREQGIGGGSTMLRKNNDLRHGPVR
jgi:hypothetical protein